MKTVRIKDLETFREKAKQLGTIVQTSTDSTTTSLNNKFTAWASEPAGGCGLGSCRCSPGIWVSARENGQVVEAHFGTDFERGEDSHFNEKDYAAFVELKRMVKL